MSTVCYDFEQKEAKISATYNDHQKPVEHAKQYAANLLAKRKAAGEKFPHYVPAVHRVTNEIRWFNIEPSKTNLGWVIYAEALVSPNWRLATKKEEADELAAILKNKVETARDSLNCQIMAGGVKASALASQAAFQKLVKDAGVLQESDTGSEDDKKPKGDKK